MIQGGGRNFSPTFDTDGMNEGMNEGRKEVRTHRSTYRGGAHLKMYILEIQEILDNDVQISAIELAKYVFVLVLTAILDYEYTFTIYVFGHKVYLKKLDSLKDGMRKL